MHKENEAGCWFFQSPPQGSVEARVGVLDDAAAAVPAHYAVAVHSDPCTVL